MHVLGCISTWRDAELLRDCLLSLQAADVPALVLDGAYSTYLGDSSTDWHTDADELDGAMDSIDPPPLLIDALPNRPWRHEAEKRTELLRAGVRAGAEWLLVIDADERLESEPAALRCYLATLRAEAWWAGLTMVDGHYAPRRIPRLLRAHPSLECRPPMDWHVYRGGQRIAWLGEADARMEHAAEVPPTIARLRHERDRRSIERRDMTAAYLQRRRAEHGCG